MRRALMRLVLLALVPLLIVESAIFGAWYYGRWNDQRAENVEAARHVAAVFEDFIQDVRRQELAIGQAFSRLRPYTPAQMAEFLRGNLNEYHSVQTWNWFGPDGQLVVSSDPAASIANVGAQEYFARLRSGRRWAMSDLSLNASTGAASFIIARRVEDNKGTFLGVVSAVVDPKEFGKHIAELRRGGAAAIGDVGIFDRHGVRVYGSDPRRSQHVDCRPSDPLLKAALADNARRSGVLRLPEYNENFMTARVPIADFGWVAGARRPVREVMADVYTGLWVAGGASLLVTLLSGVFAARMSRGLIHQLRSLKTHADAIARGELGHVAESADILELADLAGTFNRMGVAVRDAQQKLEAANTELEERVRQRTSQLATTIRRLENEVSQRLRVEQELRGVSSYARGLIEASLDPMVTISPEGKVTDVNEATVKATGAARERLIGSDFSDYFTEPERAREGYRKVLAEGLVHDYPLTICHVDGRTTDVLYNAVVYRNSAGDIQGVFAAARDVTERLRIEREIRAVSRYARGLIEANLDPMVTISPEGKVTDVNEATVKA
ncbi:MAG: PAS domain S-box protein, partial [Thermoguttaceae bacterium]